MPLQPSGNSWTLPINGLTERTPYIPSGTGHPRRTDTEATTRNVDDIETTAAPAKYRRVSAVTVSNATSTPETAGNARNIPGAAGSTTTTIEAMDTVMITRETTDTPAETETHLAPASRITGLGFYGSM